MSVEVNSSDALDLAFRRARIVAVTGSNFSGRSCILRSAVGLIQENSKVNLPQRQANGPAIYIGPEIYNAISGLTSTVKEELRIHGRRDRAPAIIERLISASHMESLFDRSPFALSGGEQASLVLVSSLLLSPNLLALDGTLEQLAPDLRHRILAILQDTNEICCPIIIADNRLSEIDSLVESVNVKECNQRSEKSVLLPIGSLCPDAVSRLPTRASERITLNGVSFKYPNGPQALREISIVLEPGYSYVLTGRNGSGKSTLAKILVGILKPTQGKLQLGNINFNPWVSPGQVVGYHFQNPDLQLFETTVLDEMRRGKHTERTQDEKYAHAVLEAFGLEKLTSCHPLGLSFPFALRKRVALAATLCMQTDWIILDEPTLGQDEESTQAIANVVHNLVKLGKSVIVISHCLSLHKLLNAKHLIIEKGELSCA